MPDPIYGGNRCWPRISEDFVASNGFTIHALASTDEMRRHGRAMPNGLSYPGPYDDIAASGGNVVFEVTNPSGRTIASGSLKSGIEGIAFVNFLRGSDNVEFPATSPAFAAAGEWADAINARTIALAATPGADGLFHAAVPDAPAPDPIRNNDRNVVARAMTAFMHLFNNARTHAAMPDAGPAAGPADDAPHFAARPAPADAWVAIASPGAPRNGGISVVPAMDASMLRYIIEQNECRMMWEFPQALAAVKRGEIQVAGLWDSNNTNNPIVGYAVLSARQGNLVLSQVTGRFDHPPSPDMAQAAQSWVREVQALAPGQAGPSGVTRNLALDGNRFTVENYQPGVTPHYDDYGRLIEHDIHADFHPGLAMSTRFGDHGPQQMPDPAAVEMKVPRSILRLETILPPSVRFDSAAVDDFGQTAIIAYNDPAPTIINVMEEVGAGRAVVFKVRSIEFGIRDGEPIHRAAADDARDEAHLAHELSGELGQMLDDANDGDEIGHHGEPDLHVPTLVAMLHRADSGEVMVEIKTGDDITNREMAEAVREAVERTAALMPDLANDMRDVVIPVREVIELTGAAPIPAAPAPAPARPAGPGGM